MYKLSIITINLNNARGLRKTIESVLNQSFTDFEYIIIDGGSSDTSVEIIKEYQEKITYWISEPDAGIYNAMNKGIDKAKGEYCLFLNSGDELYSNEIIKEVFRLEKISGYDIIYGNLARTFPDSSTDIIKMPEHITLQFLLNATLCHPVTFIKRELFSRFGKYREDLQIVSDWAFFLRVIIFANTSQIHVDKIISNFRMDGLSSAISNQSLLYNEREKVINESFSKDLLTICTSYDKYKKFHSKRVFSIFRKIKKYFLKISKISTYKNYVLRNRNTFFIKILYKQIRYQLSNPLSIPIIIINFNRLTDLKKLLNFLIKRGHSNIVIVDNNSDYLPLLEYYKQIENEVEIIKLEKNWGHMVFWENEDLFRKYSSGYYVVTDSDIIPNDNLPLNYLSKMIKYLNKNLDINKVGFALKIDDIPETFRLNKLVIGWELKYWENEVENNVYKSPIDTTFAIYFPKYHTKYGNFYNALRLGGDFCAKHGGWYLNHNNLSDEQRHYILTANNSNSWKIDLKGNLVCKDNNLLYYYET